MGPGSVVCYYSTGTCNALSVVPHDWLCVCVCERERESEVDVWWDCLQCHRARRPCAVNTTSFLYLPSTNIFMPLPGTVPVPGTRYSFSYNGTRYRYLVPVTWYKDLKLPYGRLYTKSSKRAATSRRHNASSVASREFPEKNCDRNRPHWTPWNNCAAPLPLLDYLSLRDMGGPSLQQSTERRRDDLPWLP